MIDEPEAGEPAEDTAPKGKGKAKPAAKEKPAPKITSVWKSQTVFTEADERKIIARLGGDPETDKLIYTPEDRDGVHGTTLELEA